MEESIEAWAKWQHTADDIFERIFRKKKQFVVFRMKIIYFNKSTAV